MTRAQKKWGNLYFITRMDGLLISSTEQILNLNLAFCQKYLKMCKYNINILQIHGKINPWVKCTAFLQCNTNIKFLSEYEYEYIRKWNFHRIRISNIFITKRLTEYEYWIYSYLETWPNTNTEYICSSVLDRIRILNIFVLSNLDEYEY